MGERLLLVEDDDRIRVALRLGLEDDGYQVVEAASGEAALRAFAERAPDVLVVDLMLGGMDGFSVIRSVRRTHDIPIIIVSARTDTHDVVAGLEAGADDYVRKPVQVKEISARLRALRRRTSQVAGSPAEIVVDSGRGLVLSVGSGRLTRSGSEVHLTLTEFRMLSELAHAPGRVLSRSALLNAVWDRDYFGDERLVDVHIRRLRKKIERDPAEPCLIVTVRGLGYRLDRR